MRATELVNKLEPLPVAVVPAETPAALRAAAILRATSFYVYPAEREFSGGNPETNQFPWACAYAVMLLFLRCCTLAIV